MSSRTLRADVDRYAGHHAMSFDLARLTTVAAKNGIYMPNFGTIGAIHERAGVGAGNTFPGVAPSDWSTEMRPEYTPEFIASFWAKAERQGDCLVWTRGCFRDGYGHTSMGTKKRRYHTRAHRVAFELTFGPIPEGMEVCHSCDNPPCIEPSHLFLGTHQDNMDDMATKGRSHPSLLAGERHPNALLNADQVRAILLEYTPRDPLHGATALAARYGVSQSAIANVVRGHRWRALYEEVRGERGEPV